MRLRDGAILAQLILLLALSAALPALAAHESGRVGPYVVSFDMNTTRPYTVYVESGSTGTTSMGIGFTRYNMTIDSDDHTASLVLTHYDELMIANLTANEYIVYYALIDSGADTPKIYSNVTIDGQHGVLGNFRFERQFLGQGQYQEGDLVVAAAYSPDAREIDGLFWGKTDCRVISTYPWEIIRDLINTLHVEVPAEDRAPEIRSSPFEDLIDGSQDIVKESQNLTNSSQNIVNESQNLTNGSENIFNESQNLIDLIQSHQ